MRSLQPAPVEARAILHQLVETADREAGRGLRSRLPIREGGLC